MDSPRPAPLAGALARQPVELLEDLVHLILGDAGAPIGHLELHLVRRLVRARPEGDRSIGRAVLGGVLQQVDQHLLHEYAVDRYQRQIAGDVDLHLTIAQHRPGALERLADQAVERLPLAVHLHARRGDPGHVEEVAHQAI